MLGAGIAYQLAAQTTVNEGFRGSTCEVQALSTRQVIVRSSALRLQNSSLFQTTGPEGMGRNSIRVAGSGGVRAPTGRKAIARMEPEVILQLRRWIIQNLRILSN